MTISKYSFPVSLILSSCSTYHEEGLTRNIFEIVWDTTIGKIIFILIVVYLIYKLILHIIDVRFEKDYLKNARCESIPDDYDNLIKKYGNEELFIPLDYKHDMCIILFEGAIFICGKLYDIDDWISLHHDYLTKVDTRRKDLNRYLPPTFLSFNMKNEYINLDIHKVYFGIDDRLLADLIKLWSAKIKLRDLYRKQEKLKKELEEDKKKPNFTFKRTPK